MMREGIERSLSYCKRHPGLVILGILFVSHLFFRFYGFEDKHGFAWDQVDNAWAAKNIIVEHRLPLVGMVAKQNSGFYIGPLYYYFVAFFYLLTNLDPFASVIIAGVTSIITFFVLYIFCKKLFSESVALVVLFLHTFSTFIISSDRTQWPINFLAPISLVIFYTLYKIMTGNEKYIYYLAVILGLSWQLNFTAIFFFIISFLTLPFFPRTKESLKNILISVPLLLLFFLPNIFFDVQHRATSLKHLGVYLSEYYHGFHFLRMIQLAKDAFIEFASLFDSPVLSFGRYIFLPVFFLVYHWRAHTKQKIMLSYLIFLWFLIPWIVFSVYKGEISNYYFSLTRPITLIAIAFLIVWFYSRKFFLAKALIVVGFVGFVVTNTNQFFEPKFRSLSYHRVVVEQKIKAGEIIEFSPIDPESYLYYVLTLHEKSSQGRSK